MIGAQAIKAMLSARNQPTENVGVGSKKGTESLNLRSALADEDPFGKPNTASKTSLRSGDLSEDPDLLDQDRQLFQQTV